MNPLSLLEEAQASGLTVHTDGLRLVVTGPRRLEPLARRVLDAKAALMTLLRRHRGEEPGRLVRRGRAGTPARRRRPRLRSTISAGARVCQHVSTRADGSAGTGSHPCGSGGRPAGGTDPTLPPEDRRGPPKRDEPGPTALPPIAEPWERRAMGFEVDRGVIVCDLFGCWNELPVPPDLAPTPHVEQHPDWSHRDGLYRCPKHRFGPGSPWP